MSRKGLDTLQTNLVVADESRTDKTICLAVSPALKVFGIPGRGRLFEVKQKVREINLKRLKKAPHHCFTGSSADIRELREHLEYEMGFIIAMPHMALYIEYSTHIYQIYLRRIAAEDIHVYSIDEVMMDVSPYLNLYQCSAKNLAKQLIQDVQQETGITATAGIGENLYLCKCAMDIIAKHISPDKNGVRIAEVDMHSYREKLWTHRPLTDFWRIGMGTAKKLEAEGIYTMGDLARCSIGQFEDYYNEDLLYKMFGIKAELLIDHAWGYKPCTMAAIKGYRPSSSSLSVGQVLTEPYTMDMAEVVIKEMGDQLSLRLVEKNLVCSSVGMWIGFDARSLENSSYQGETEMDFYGRILPRSQGGTVSFRIPLSSSNAITSALLNLFAKIRDCSFLVRRITVSANDTKDATKADYHEVCCDTLFSSSFEKKDAQIQNKESLLKKKREHRKRSWKLKDDTEKMWS